jgi:hypothetical protein
MIDYLKILEMFYSTSKWSINGDSYDGIVWLSNDPKPTQTEMDAQWPEVNAIIAARQASRKRQQAYIAEADPLFFKAQRGEATMEEWQAKVAEIKTRFPKD